MEFQSLEAEGHRILPVIFFRGQIFSAWKRAQTLAFTCNHIKTRQSQNCGASYMNACCSSPRVGEDTILTEKRVRINNADGGK